MSFKFCNSSIVDGIFGDMTSPDPVTVNGGATPGKPAEREVQRAYWKEHSSEATVESMMLDSKAKDIDRLERPEVCEVRRRDHRRLFYSTPISLLCVAVDPPCGCAYEYTSYGIGILI